MIRPSFHCSVRFSASGALAGLLVALAVFSGCTRSYYRRWADNEVYEVVGEKTQDPRWSLPGYTINIDPRSRMYDPNCPDFERQPPDDPAAHQLMHCVDGMEADAVWEWYGKTPYAQNPNWLEYLPRNEQGQVVVDAAEAVQLALLNSREYQRELEDLYLSALDVTFERFRFDVQFFGNNSTAYNVAGPLAPGALGESSSLLSNDTSFEARKLFANGAELLVGLANSIVWEFSGGNNQFSTTLLDFSLIQPLLRGGTRAVVMERLTLAERTLLYNVRAMERYRKGFFTEIYAGHNPDSGPQRRGGLFGGAGLEGFTGTGGGFGRVGGADSQQPSGNFGVSGGVGAGQTGGFLGLLQRRQVIRNEEANVAALGGSVAQLQAAYDAGRIDRFQVDLARQSLYNTQSQLMIDNVAYQNVLDGYKVNLGLPPQLDIEIRDPLLAQFELIDPRIAPLQNQMTRIQVRLGDSIIALREQARAAGGLEEPSFIERIERLREAIASAARIQQAATRHIPAVETDIAEFIAVIPQRRRSLELLQARARRGTEGIGQSNEELDRIAETELFANRDAIDADIQRLEDLPGRLREDLATVQAALSRFPQEFHQIEGELSWLADHAATAPPAMVQQRLNGVLARIPDNLVELYGEVLELSLLQARARTEKIVLVPIDMNSDDAIRIARCNRLDWMNARGALVDIWRLIEFNANALESGLNLSINGDVRNNSDSPFAFNSATGRLQMGVEFDAPLTRLAERNNYRQTLIDFQQARRAYYAFTDRVAQSLRVTLRQIELDQANFELRRAAVRIAIDQVELTQLRLREPPQPGVEATFGNTTARDLVSALSDLLNVQNDFVSVWTNYQAQRLILDYNLETMQLDSNGMWVDPGQDVGLPGFWCLETRCDDPDVLHAADARCNDGTLGLSDPLMRRRLESEAAEAEAPPLPQVDVESREQLERIPEEQELPEPPVNPRAQRPRRNAQVQHAGRWEAAPVPPEPARQTQNAPLSTTRLRR